MLNIKNVYYKKMLCAHLIEMHLNWKQQAGKQADEKIDHKTHNKIIWIVLCDLWAIAQSREEERQIYYIKAIFLEDAASRNRSNEFPQK